MYGFTGYIPYLLIIRILTRILFAEYKLKNHQIFTIQSSHISLMTIKLIDVIYTTLLIKIISNK